MRTPSPASANARTIVSKVVPIRRATHLPPGRNGLGGHYAISVFSTEERIAWTGQHYEQAALIGIRVQQRRANSTRSAMRPKASRMEFPCSRPSRFLPKYWREPAHRAFGGAA